MKPANEAGIFCFRGGIPANVIRRLVFLHGKRQAAQQGLTTHRKRLRTKDLNFFGCVPSMEIFTKQADETVLCKLLNKTSTLMADRDQKAGRKEELVSERRTNHKIFVWYML